MFGMNGQEKIIAGAKRLEKIELKCQVNWYPHSGPLASYHLETEIVVYLE